MKIFDFDRVLFDTDRLIDFIDEHGLEDIPRGPELEKALDEAGFNWKEFVFPGVAEYLAANTDCVIVSSSYSRNREDNVDEEMEKMFQKIKIERCGLAELMEDRIEITGESKELAFEKYAGEGNIIVDDEIEHLHVAERLGYKPVWFRTKKNLMSTTKEGMSEHIRGGMVTNFEQFIELEKELEKNA